MNHTWRTTILLVSYLGVTGCPAFVNSLANSPANISHLQVVSAGHTGCPPDDNQLSNVSVSTDGGTTWNATCKGKIYLCSAVASGSNAESYSCAPAVSN
jgi:hypothetical protein